VGRGLDGGERAAKGAVRVPREIGAVRLIDAAGLAVPPHGDVVHVVAPRQVVDVAAGDIEGRVLDAPGVALVEAGGGAEKDAVALHIGVDLVVPGSIRRAAFARRAAAALRASGRIIAGAVHGRLLIMVLSI